MTVQRTDVKIFRRVRVAGSVHEASASAEREICCTTTVGISNLYVKAGEIVRLCIALATLRSTRDDDDGLMDRTELGGWAA